MEDEESSTAPQKTNTVFEFTKRKRWADTLIAETANACILAIAPTGSILHCDASVQSVTGYPEDDLVGKNLADFLHEGDTHAFFRAFDECIAIQRELTFYLRIKPSDRRDTSSRLVELKANPCYTPGTTECLCVFAVLAPYPSAAVRDLDDFLALRIENERLNLQLEALRNGTYSDDDMWESGSEDEENFNTHSPLEDNIVNQSERAIAQASAAIGAFSVATGAKFPSAASSNGFGAQQTAEQTEDGQPAKKKRRMVDSTQGRVCTACGRNNSPEWRKGPQGPKTLCNACGLRWAKKVKGPTKEGTEAD